MAEITTYHKYVNSTAYHESGHTVVAAVQGMPLRNLGVHMDSQGCGKTFYWHRVPDGSRNNAGSGIERERTIVATSAGYVAQKRFYSDTLSEDVRMQMDVGAQSDTTLVVELLEEMYSGDRNALSAARLKLFAESAQLVEKHWQALDTLAKNLLAKEWVSFAKTQPVLSFAKILAGYEINSLHTFLNPPVCYHYDPCSTSSDFGWAHFPAVFAHVKAFCLKIWRFDNSSRY